MKRIFSEVQKERMLKSQLNLLKKDLKDCLTLLKSGSHRGAYIFLFDAIERIVDLFFVKKGEKPTSRIEREELIFKHFSPETYRKFRSFYYERRGGMYEDFLFISSKDFSELLKFFDNLLSEVRTKVEIDDEVRKIVEEIKSCKRNS
jgi:hypothetical protein